MRFFSIKPFRDPAELTLLTVFPTTTPPWPVDKLVAASMEKQGLESANDFLDGISEKIAALGYNTRILAVPGAPAITILREAARSKPDLLVTGTHGRKGLTRFVLGNVSHVLLHSASYPVLVYR